jgi:hypothetical protein
MDLSKLSDADLYALKAGDLSKVSDDGLSQLSGARPQKPQPKTPTLLSEALGSIPAQFGFGAARGIGGIGATLGLQGEEGRKTVEKTLVGYGANPESLAYGAGKLGSEIGATGGVGSLLARGVSMIPNAASKVPALIEALRTAGMSTGTVLPESAKWLGAKGVDLALRTGAAGAVGATSAAAIDPNEALQAGGISALMPAGFKAAGAAGNGLGGLLFKPNIKNADLAKKAIDEYGIPLGVADISGSSTTKALRSILNDAPFTGGIGARQMEQTQRGFNRAVGKTFGADADKLTPEVLDAAKGKMGKEFDRLWGRNNLVVDDMMIGKMSELDSIAAKLPKNEGQSLKAEINDILSKMADDGAGNLVINGDAANKFQSYLRRRADSSAGLKGELSDLRKTMLDAFKRSVSPEDAQALSANMGQYKSFKTVEPLLNKGEAGVAGRAAGDVPASLLPSALAQNYAKVAGSPLADLSQIGSQFLVNRAPQTGGSARAAIQNSALGAGLMYGGMSNPLLATAVIPTAMGVNKYLGSPAVAQRYLSSTPNRNRLAELFGESVYRATPAIAAQ